MQLLSRIYPEEPRSSWSDERLVDECRRGNAEAWNALVEKYKALIYSVPVRFGLSPEDATDVFQEVCFSLLTEMKTIEKPRALPAWLAHTAWHKCLHWSRQQRRYVEWTGDGHGDTAPADGKALPEAELQALEQAQTLRDTIGGLPRRCIELIRMLFYETPPVPYQEVAARLGLAVGSIGFTRLRCLDQLKRGLDEKGFR